MGTLALALLALLALLGLSSQDPADDGRGWRWRSLDLELWIEPELESLHLEGRGTLELVDERSSGPRLDVNADLLEVEDVRADGARLEFGSYTSPWNGRERRTARLRLASEVERGARLEVEFACQSIGDSAQFAVRREAALASWVQAWYPVPFDGGEALLRELLAAPGTTRFHLPEGWRSVSNGSRATVDEPGVEGWRVTQPVARSFACAPLRLRELEVDQRTVAVARMAATQGDSDLELRGIAGILRALEARFGPYPYPSYTAVEVPDGVGDFLGSSEQGFILVRPVAFRTRDGNLALFGHELAHGWWGNRVGTRGPGNLLLDEALSQYCAVLAIEALEGEDAATDFLRFSRSGFITGQCARGYFGMLREGYDRPLATLSSGDAEAHQLVDAKGHWVYRMLRDLVGDEVFFGVLRDVLRDFAVEPLTLPELRERFVQAAPDKDVRGFFAQWLDRAGAPVLDLEWEARGDRALVAVRQVQAGEPYRLSLELGLHTAAGTRIQTVELTATEGRFTLDCDGPPTAVELDPRHRLLIWTPEYGPRPEH